MHSSINVRVPLDTFEPGLLSIAELHWLADHIKEPPVAAFMDPLPPGVIRVSVEPVLQRIYEFTELERHRGTSWAGHTAILDTIQDYLAWQERSAEIRRRSRGRVIHPSQYHWDEGGRPYKFAIGADSAALIRTQILDDGSRKPFGVQLAGDAADAVRADLSDVAPWVKASAEAAKSTPKDTIIEHDGKDVCTLTCSICHHTEQFQPGSRGRRMAALGRMSRHLKNAKTDSTRHRMLYSRSFPSR